MPIFTGFMVCGLHGLWVKKVRDFAYPSVAEMSPKSQGEKKISVGRWSGKGLVPCNFLVDIKLIPSPLAGEG
jgi:hypothetical protein